MNILIFGDFPPPVYGVSLSNKILYNYLKQEEHIVEKLNPSLGKAVFKNKKFFFQKIFKSLKTTFVFNKKSKDIDIVYITMSQSKMGFLKCWPVLKLCQIKKIPYVIHLKGNSLPKTFISSNKILKDMILNILNNSKAVILLSEILEHQELYQSLDTNTHIVRNFVEEDYFVSYKEKMNVLDNSEKLKLFYLSNLMETKGIIDLLKAIIILKKKNIEFKLLIAGSWEERIKNKGEKLIDKIGEEYVDYIGFVDGQKKEKLISESNIFILPTYYPQEGQPISILEAMAGGNTIITTKHSGIPDIITEGENGFFVKKKNPDSIADTIEEIYNNKDILKKIAKTNINEATQKYTTKKFGENIEKILLG